MRIGAQIVSDDARDEQRRGIFRGLNDDFHARELSRNERGCHDQKLNNGQELRTAMKIESRFATTSKTGAPCSGQGLFDFTWRPPVLIFKT
jgi:hypothetical protein